MSATTPPQPARLRAIARNVFAILGSDIAKRITSFALFALVARFLGERAFGQLSLAQSTFFFLGYSLAGMGIRWFLARELAKRPEKTDSYLVNGTALVMITSTLAIIGFAIVGRISGYADDTLAAILLMGLTLYPYTATLVLEGTFVGREKMQYVFLVNAPVTVFNIAATYFLLQNGGSLYHIIGVQIAAYTLAAVCQWALMLRYVTRPPLRVSRREMIELARATSSFFGIDAVVAIISSMQLYLVSLVADESRLGVFSSASQLAGPMVLVMASIVGSLLPVLTRQVEPSYRRLETSAHRLIELLLWFAVPTVVGVALVANDLLVLVYERETFGEGAIYLQILAIGLIFRALTMVLGNVLYATSNEQQNLRIVTISSVLTLILNITGVLVAGPVGVAVAAITTNLIEYILHREAIGRVLKLNLRIIPLFWRALLASVVMAVVLLLIPSSLNVLLRVVIGAAVYAVALIAILRGTVGSIGEIRSKYLSGIDDAPVEMA